MVVYNSQGQAASRIRAREKELLFGAQPNMLDHANIPDARFDVVHSRSESEAESPEHP